MKKTSKAISIAKTIAVRMARHMSTELLAILGVMVVAIFLFGALLARESLEDADLALKVLSALLAVVVVGVGLAALITGHLVNERLTVTVRESAAAIKVAEIDLEKQRERAANAERALLELQGRINKEQQARSDLEFVVRPRELDRLKLSQFSASLRHFAGTSVEVGAIDETEAKRLAGALVDLLRDAGWRVTELGPLTEGQQARVGDGVRIHIAEPWEDNPLTPAAGALYEVMRLSSIVTRRNPIVPDQPAATMRVIVGPQDTMLLRRPIPE